MIASWPFSAPAWPPETGASRKTQPRAAAASAISRASFAEAVVWSTTIAPSGSAGSASPTTWRTSSSLPTQSATSSAPATASAIVAAALPLYSAAQRPALAGVRLKTADLVARPRQVAGHRIAHHPKPDERRPHARSRNRILTG